MLNTIKRPLGALALAWGVAASPAMAEAPAATPAPEMQIAAPAVWTIEKPNGHTIALFGTVHILPQGTLWRSDPFTQAFSKADIVVLETPIADMATPELTEYLQQSMMNPPGVTLSTLLKPDEKAIVERAAALVGTPFEALEPMRPWFVAVQMTLGFAMKQGFDLMSGVDRAIEGDAKAAGKTLGYFETAREQLDIFITLPKDQEIAFLVLGSQELLGDPHELDDLVHAWATGDQAAIDKIMNGAFDQMPELIGKLLTDRNARWVEKISTDFMADDKNYLIAVGAGHLAGEKGVPAMLRAKGIAVSGP